MRAELEVLRSTILRVGLLVAGMACSPEERLRLQLLAHEDPAGITTANIQELHRQVLQITAAIEGSCPDGTGSSCAVVHGGSTAALHGHHRPW